MPESSTFPLVIHATLFAGSTSRRDSRAEDERRKRIASEGVAHAGADNDGKGT
jgi:hypothetical protein